jgi:CRISPR-associated protein Cmr6
MKNLSKLYYKDYFKDIDFRYLTDGKGNPENVRKLKARNGELCSAQLKEIKANPLVNSTFSLTVAYPGLVTGVGINHEANIEGEFKLGVHFDYTWGMPVIYGSSVKGVLKAYFKEFYTGDINKDHLIDDIFNGGKKSIYDRDIFFDAVIVKSDTNGHILSSDSITPHGDNPLKNPIPLTFMKIAPGCTIEFRFKLVDSKIDDKEFKAEEKEKLFKKIIGTVGVGAKANVGYGQFE